MHTIYFDYQATTPIDPRVLEQMTPYWLSSFGNPHSSDHIVGWRAADAVKKAAGSVADLIGADPDELVFTSGATESNNMALLGLARRAPASRRRVLVSAIEHKCVLAAVDVLAEREGFRVETIPVDHEGFVDLDFLERAIDDSVLFVSVMAVNNEIGTVQDIAAIAGLLASHGVLFHCDAAQAPAAIDCERYYRTRGLGESVRAQDVRSARNRGALHPTGRAAEVRASDLRRWTAEWVALWNNASGIMRWDGRCGRTYGDRRASLGTQKSGWNAR